MSGNVLLRREQYRWADDLGQSAGVARAVVMAKIANQRTVLLRALRDHPEMAGSVEVKAAGDYLGRILTLLQGACSLDMIRGMEGDAAQCYFGSIFI